MSEIIIGIDLGTTYSACGIYGENGVELISNRLGSILTPSIISMKNDRLLIGESAKQRLISHPKETVANFKRHMGSNWKFKIDKHSFSATELSSFVLKSLKEDAEVYLNQPVSRAVISVPAYFNNTQREATIQAGVLAGLEIEAIINEPTAAAMAFGLHEKPDDYTFIVLDLGGGTFDISIMEYYDQILEVQATGGDNHLGGEDFTEALIELYLKKSDIESDTIEQKDREIIYTYMEKMKKEFVHNDTISIEPIGIAKETICITSVEYRLAVQKLLSKIKETITQVVLDYDMDTDALDAILLVGGSSRLTCFRDLCLKLFKKIPLDTIDQDLAVVMGVSIQAGLKAKNKELTDVVLTDVSPYSFGVAVHNENNPEDMLFSPIIERNTVVPVSRSGHYVPVNKMQLEIQLKIYQGEHRLVSQNHYLGEISVKIPFRLKGLSEVEVRFSYDSNGILEIDARVIDSEKSYNKLIISEDVTLSEKEIQSTLRRLDKYKQHPREEEANIKMIAIADKLYTLTKEHLRIDIQNNTVWFENILASQDRKKIQKAYKEFSAYLEVIEEELNVFE